MSVTTSVIIPVRNGERFIAEAIGSATNQIASTDEILVVDDGSTDKTRTVVEQINDARVKIIPGLAKGVSSARNIGMDHAAGKFICFLDSDDIWPTGRHEILLDVLHNNFDYDAAYGRIRVIVEPDAPAIPQPEPLDGKYFYSHIGTGLYRRELIEHVGKFAEDMHFGEDTDFSLRLQEIGMRPYRADIVSLLYRRHSENTSNDNIKNRNGLTETIIRKLQRARKRGGNKC